MIQFIRFISLRFLKLSLFFIISQTLIAQGTFTEIHKIACNDSILIGRLGYPTWATAKIVKAPHNGYAIIPYEIGFQTMHYTSPPCFRGSDTIVVTCAKATQLTCDTGIYIMNIECAEEANKTLVYNITCRDSNFTEISGFPNSKIKAGPFNGIANILHGIPDMDYIKYKPDSSFSGMDYIKLSLFNGMETWILLYHVECSIPTNSKNVENAKSKIFPNPVSGDVLHILSNHESLKNLYLINSLGIPIVRTYSQVNDEINVDISYLPSGWYTLILEEHFGKHYQRFLILR